MARHRATTWPAALAACGLAVAAWAGTADPAEGPQMPATSPPAETGGAAADPHAAALAADQFPSASVCATCHPAQYDEWSYSSHAYASISPVFHKFEQRINELAQGTVGYFCLRCHSGVGTTLGEARDLAVWDKPRVSREGVTCVSCHRVNESYGKVNGDRRIVPGSIFEPMYGPFGGDGVAKVAADPEAYNVALSPDGFGLQMHRQGIAFEQIDKSELCLSCHQVAVHPGIKLETVWDEYRASPARADGVSCQDCHMSTRPGQPSGFAKGPAAVVNGRVVEAERTHYNHGFIGPGYPIAHPGIFPHHPEQDRFTVQQWLAFDYRAGWGTDEFEDRVASGEAKVEFAAPWESADDRVEARLIVDENLAKIDKKAALRRELMEASSALEGPFFHGTPRVGEPLRFHYRVSNRNTGHNMPSGSLGAQPEIWLDVALVDPDGRNVWESGYVDSHGDMADLHSRDVAAGTIEHDDQLFNLQSKFLTTNLKGTDREMYLPVPFDGDQIPFIRPSGVPTSVLNHPPFIRMEKRSLPPLGSRDASYRVPASALAVPGTYRLSVRLRSRAEPIYFMDFIRATTDMVRAMNEWMVDIHPSTTVFEVGGGRSAGPGATPAAASSAATSGPAVTPAEAVSAADGYLEAAQRPPDTSDFRPAPVYPPGSYTVSEQLAIYGGKSLVKTARPPIELGRRLYDRGPVPASGHGLGEKNPTQPWFYAYGDWRTAAAYNDDGVPDAAHAAGTTHQSTVATRLNLELDLGITATERIHAFVRPFDQDGSFLRYDLGGKNEGYEESFDFNLETLFFEGDMGSIVGGFAGHESDFDLPFAVGLVPLLTQNGIWVLDAFTGAAATVPAFSSRALDASNVDLTFFAGFDRVTTPAVPEGDARVYGMAGFVEANRGYWEFGAARVSDTGREELGYYNLTAAFSKRYRAFVSNSVRVIANLGQDPAPGVAKTADGALLLIENSLITRKPLTLVPYLNLFAGFDTPQALARAAGTGGVLASTGINFESDGLTGFPTLDDRGHDSWGGAVGVEYLFNLDRQVVFEAAAVQRMSDRRRLDPGDEYALGFRFQQPISNAWILRFDAMHGWRQDGEDLAGNRIERNDIFGARLEIRRKL